MQPIGSGPICAHISGLFLIITKSAEEPDSRVHLSVRFLPVANIRVTTRMADDWAMGSDGVRVTTGALAYVHYVTGRPPEHFQPDPFGHLKHHPALH